MGDTWLRIVNGTVVNAEVHEAEPYAEDGVTWAQDSVAGIGWSYDGAAFTPPAPPAPVVPAEVQRYQARGALYNAQPNGALLQQVDAAVAQAGGLTQIWWTEAPTFQRADLRFNAIGANLGLAPAQIDALFVQAAAL